MNILQEGYLQYYLPDSYLSEHDKKHYLRKMGKSQLEEACCVLYEDRELRMFASADKTKVLHRLRITGFCKWDGNGIKNADNYGLELKTNLDNVFVVAYNRKDLDDWCRGLVGTICCFLVLFW